MKRYYLWILFTLVAATVVLYLTFDYVTRGPWNVVIRDETIFVGDPDKVMRQLQLTHEQMEEVGATNARFRSTMLDFRKDLRPLTERVQKELFRSEVDLNKIRDLLNEISSIKNERRIQAIRHRLEIEKILTEEQRSKLSLRFFHEPL